MPFLIDQIRSRLSKKPTQEEFKTSHVFERLEKQGFKPLIKNDQLESRRDRMRESLAVTLDSLNKAQTVEEQGKAVDEAYVLVMDIAGPWLRSMDNSWLAHKVNCFLELYAEFRYIPEFLGLLVTCASAIINLSMTNIDVEPLTPIIIQAMQPYGYSPVIPSSQLPEYAKPVAKPYPEHLPAELTSES